MDMFALNLVHRPELVPSSVRRLLTSERLVLAGTVVVTAIAALIVVRLYPISPERALETRRELEARRGAVGALTALVVIEDGDHRQGVAFVVEHAAAAQPVAVRPRRDGRLPPEDAGAAAIGNVSARSRWTAARKSRWPFGRLREWRRLVACTRSAASSRPPPPG